MRGFSGLLILILMGLLVLVALFAATKFIVPNPQTIEESNKIQEDTQNTANQLQQKSTQNQSVEID